MKLSNKALALLVILAMSLSLFSTLSLLNKFHSIVPSPEELTGKAQNVQGEVNLTVEGAISIILHNSTIDFGLGFVNTSKTGVCVDDANLSINYSSTPIYLDEDDCWTSFTSGQPTQPTNAFTIENEGNQNVTLEVYGPHPTDFFSGVTASSAHYNLSWAGHNIEGNACSSGLVTTWTAFNGTVQTICPSDYFGFVAGADDMAVHIRVQIPSYGLGFTEYKNSSIEFQAS